MIHYAFDIKRNEVYLSFTGNNFTSFVELFKAKKLTFNPTSKHWECSINKFLGILDEINDIEELPVDEQTLVLLEENKYGRNETKFKRRLYDTSLLKAPPLGKYQEEDIKKFISQNRLICGHDVGLGKAQPLYARILTPYGYKAFSEIKVGDEIINASGNTSRVEAVYEQGEKEVFKLTFSDGSTAESCKEHLWSYKTNNDRSRGKNFRTASLEDILMRHTTKKGIDCYLPSNPVITFSSSSIPLVIDPYALGLLIGNGCFRKVVKYSTADIETLDTMNNLFHKFGLYFKKRKDYDYDLIRLPENKEPKNAVKDELVRLGLFGKLSKDKHIPKEYLLASPQERIALLQGLLDTDGYISKSGDIHFSTSSPQLSEDFCFLVQSLGGYTRCVPYIPKIGDKEYSTAWYITVMLPDTSLITPFRLKRKLNRLVPRTKYSPVRRLVSVKPVGKTPCRCIKTSAKDGLYLTDNMIITHNTYIAISGLNHLRNYGEIDKVLIVSVPETLYNWKRELKIFSDYTDDDILVVTKDNRNIIEQWDNKKIIITSYNTFILISDFYYQKEHGKNGVKKYRNPPIDFSKWSDKPCLILDEGHKIKNRASRTFHTLKLHKEFFNYRYILTATPYPNDITEIWSLMYMLDESILGVDYNEFVERVASIGNRFSAYAINYFKEREVAKIVDRLKPFLIRREKAVCLPNLPKLDIKKVFVEMGSALRGIYQDIIISELARLKEEDGVVIPRKVVQKFPYLTLACSDPSTLLDKFEASWSFDLVTRLKKWKIKNNPKIDMVDSIMDEHKGEKIILWSTHPATIDALAEHYKSHNPIVVHGQSDTEGMVKGEFRDKELHKFRTSKDCNLAIISPLCLGVGVNIPESSVAIHWDRNWSVVVYLQSIGRNHRATSKKDVIQYVLVFDDSLEVNQDAVLEGKTQLNEKLMKKDILTNDEWRKIFNGKTEFDF